MLTGDCLLPTEHRFHAEFTRPQNDGTENTHTHRSASPQTEDIELRSRERD